MTKNRFRFQRTHETHFSYWSLYHLVSVDDGKTWSVADIMEFKPHVTLADAFATALKIHQEEAAH